MQNVLLVRRISAPGKAWIGLPIKACTSRVTTKTYLRCDIVKKSVATANLILEESVLGLAVFTSMVKKLLMIRNIVIAGVQV